MNYKNKDKNIDIVAENIVIGENVSFGNDIHIRAKGIFQIGSYSRLGSDTQILGNNIEFGEHLFNSKGLRIGGGGRQHPNANFKIGDRCTIHNNFINVCEPVIIGNDVGLSPDTSIITHGYWLSVLEGYPASFKGVSLGDGVIVGYRSVLLMGVSIADYCVVGAQSVVSKSLKTKGIYAGSPAKLIAEINTPSIEEKKKKLIEIVNSYIPIAEYHHIKPKIKIEYPNIYINNFTFDVENFAYEGKEDEETDDLRDYLRKWGIRIYTKRPFTAKFSFDD